jgi:hypothetical protein
MALSPPLSPQHIVKPNPMCCKRQQLQRQPLRRPVSIPPPLLPSQYVGMSTSVKVTTGIQFNNSAQEQRQQLRQPVTIRLSLLPSKVKPDQINSAQEERQQLRQKLRQPISIP